MFFSKALVLIFCLNLVFCFNFDTDFPIVYRDPSSALNTSANNNRLTYFGFAVILHYDFLQDIAWVQIGAPRANSPTSRSKEPGVVFRCNIFEACQFLDVDAYSISTDIFQRSVSDKQDGAWIGSVMDIDEWSGRVVVCGPRWINNRIVDYWMQGVCYWSSTNDTQSEKLIPLVDNGKAVIHDADSRTNVFYYAQGQAGFSAHLSSSANEPELLLGAPGVYNWDGTTIIYRDGPDFSPIASRLTLLESEQRKKRATSYSQFANLNVGNAITTLQTASFGLFGYAVTSGRYFNKNETLYVSAAPRARTCIGQFLVFKFASESDQALDVKDTRQGYQLGEYFGAALASGDINQDGYDDLIVGAPFYTNKKYNEGRIFVFLGSSKGSLQTPQQNAIIEGKRVGGQFGSSVMFLGDLHWDRYADVAVGAPYENDGSGVVYIYRGNGNGLDAKSCQKIVGKNFVPNIKGFGISISKPTDIDVNLYKDIAIGAYLSGHVVILRAKPVVVLHQSVISLTPRLDHSARNFQVKACFWYTGSNVPPSIVVTRRIMVDELLHRAYLPTDIPINQNITLEDENILCQNITINIKEDLNNRYDPLTVLVSQELLVAPVQGEIITIDENYHSRMEDRFCKTCPVTNTYKSTTEQTIGLSFALGCGDDNICVTKLNFESRFLEMGSSSYNEYILGSTDYLQLVSTISNEGERAYLTQLVVQLPKSVEFGSIPSNCLEQNSSSIVICNVENPLYEKKQKSIVLDLDMKDVNSEKYGEKLNFKFTVLTSSENTNPNTFTNYLNIVRVADIALTGKTSQQSYSYGNITYGKPNFTQIYQIEKFGASPIDAVQLSILVPTSIYGTEIVNFLQLYAPEGYHAGQPINCQSNVKYVMEESPGISAEFDGRDTPLYDDSLDMFITNDYSEITSTPTPLQNRFVRQAPEENVTADSEYPSNRTYYINCSNSDVICSYVNCSIGPFRLKQNTAVLQIKMLFDISSLSELLHTKDIIILSTDGIVTITSPKDFVQSGRRPDSVRVSSVFISEVAEFVLELWIIIVAVIAGLLLLLLVVLGLVKVGFFQRKKKEELDALKEAEVDHGSDLTSMNERLTFVYAVKDTTSICVFVNLSVLSTNDNQENLLLSYSSLPSYLLLPYSSSSICYLQLLSSDDLDPLTKKHF